MTWGSSDSFIYRSVTSGGVKGNGVDFRMDRRERRNVNLDSTTGRGSVSGCTEEYDNLLSTRRRCSRYSRWTRLGKG